MSTSGIPDLKQHTSVFAVPVTVYEKHGYRAEQYACVGPFLPDDASRIYQVGCEAIGLYRVRDNTGEELKSQNGRYDYEKIHGVLEAVRAVDNLAAERQKMIDAILKM